MKERFSKILRIPQAVVPTIALIGCVLAGGCVNPEAARGANSGWAVVRQVEGRATHVDLNGTSRRLRQGMWIDLESTVKTEPGSYVDVYFEQSRQILKVRSGSEVVLKETGRNAEGDILHSALVKAGGITVHSKQTRPVEWQITASESSISAHSTDFTSYSDGSTSLFSGVATANFRTGGIPSEPVIFKMDCTVMPPTAPGGKPYVIPTPIACPFPGVPQQTFKKPALRLQLPPR